MAEPVDFAAAVTDREKKQRRQKKTSATPPAPPRDDGRPLIRTYGGGLHDNMSAAEAALGDWSRAHPSSGVYVQDGTPRMVRAIRLATVPAGGRGIAMPPGTIVMAEPGKDLLAALLGCAARFERWDQRREDWVAIDAPARMVSALMGASPWPRLPVLAGVTAAPTLRPDGSLLDRPGYDAATGLLFDPGETVFPPVPEAPSRAEALAAVERLKALLDGFPFVSAPARSVALAAIITAVIRPAMRSAPLFTITAPRPGTGKTLLATVVGMITTGVGPVMISQAEKPEEERKRLLAVLMDAPRVVCFDNVGRALDSDSLCTILTEDRWSDRVLGETRTVNVGTSLTWLATGNNLQVKGDLAERVLECRLDANEAEPETRQFDVNLHRTVPGQRAELVVAALTIVRHWIAEGRPAIPIPQFGRFEGWSDFVRKPLVHIGEADPFATRRTIKRDDPVRDGLVSLLVAWAAVYGANSEAVREAGRHTNDQLQQALKGVAEKGGEPDLQRVGMFIRRYRDRWETVLERPDGGVERMRFVEGERDRSNVARWRVEKQEDGG